MSFKTKAAATIIFLEANPMIAGMISAVIAVTLAAVIVYWAFYQTDSKVEKKADDARVVTIAADANANVASQNVITAVNDAKSANLAVTEAQKPLPAIRERRRQAETNVNRAQQPVSNTSFNEANKERCQTYPEDCR